jgi:hypothetical protein
VKDQNGKELDREFAPNKRDPNDKYKVTVVPSTERYKIEQKDGIIKVTKK